VFKVIMCRIFFTDKKKRDGKVKLDSNSVVKLIFIFFSVQSAHQVAVIMARMI